MRRRLLIIITLTNLLNAYCQADIDFEKLTGSDSEILSVIEENMEKLAFYKDSKININAATREELEDLGLLTYNQVENLLEYIFDYGQMETIYELSLVEGIDAETVKKCLPFITVEKAGTEERFSFKNIAKYGKSDLLIKSGGTLQKKDGYIKDKYLGKPYSLTAKYYFKHKDFSIGMLGSKQEGEPFDFKHNKGFDFYSGHAAFMNIGKALKTIIAGDYKVTFGQGLVFKSNASFTSYENIIYSDAVKPSYSTSETGYFRGLAIRLGGSKTNFSLFTSHTQYNKSEGYHRTLSDFEKRDTTNVYLLGGNLNYSGRYFKIGVSGYYDFKSGDYCAGADYRFRIKRFTFCGESAIDRNCKVATINSLLINCGYNVTLTTSFRYYGKGFSSKFGNAWSRNSMSSERGLYIGLEAPLAKFWKLTFCGDIFNILLPKSTVNKPSSGFCIDVKAIWTPMENNSGYIRYNVLSKEKNISTKESVKQTGRYYNQRINLQYSVRFDNNFSLRAGLYSSIYTMDSLNYKKRTSYGFLLSASTGWMTKNKRFGYNLGTAFFDNPSYDNVIYCYEPSTLYSYSSPGIYGIGCRFFLLIKLSFLKKLDISAKINHTLYVDRTEISSGNERIAGPRKTEIKATLSYKF